MRQVLKKINFIVLTLFLAFSFQCITTRAVSASVEQSISVDGDLGEDNSLVVEEGGENTDKNDRVQSAKPKAPTFPRNALPQLGQLVQSLMIFWGWLLIILALCTLVYRKRGEIKE